MGEELKNKVLRKVRRDFLSELLKDGKRFDNRGFFDYRPISVQKNVLDTSDGSAIASIGGTKVLASVKFDIMTPFPDRPDEGFFMTLAEFLPLASESFEPGPPSEESIELARVVDRGIRSAEIIDTKSLFIEEDKVLAMFIDLYILDYLGNIADTATLAAVAALSSTQVPKVEEGKIIRGEYSRPLGIKDYPITTTFIKVGDHLLLDPSKDEELAMDTKLIIGNIPGFVCSMQKSGSVALEKEEVMQMVDLSLEKGDMLRKYLKN